MVILFLGGCVYKFEFAVAMQNPSVKNKVRLSSESSSDKTVAMYFLHALCNDFYLTEILYQKTPQWHGPVAVMQGLRGLLKKQP